MAEAGKMIVVDGIDGVGKTDLCISLLNHLENSFYVHCPDGISDITTSLAKILRTEKNPGVVKSFMMATHVKNINDCNDLKKQHNVVLDRSLLSFLAYQNISPEDFSLLSKIFDIPKLQYDHAILLIADKKSIEKRFAMRKKKDSFDIHFLDNYDTILNGYLTKYSLIFKDNCHIIETSNLSKNDVKNKILGIIK